MRGDAGSVMGWSTTSQQYCNFLSPAYLYVWYVWVNVLPHWSRLCAIVLHKSTGSWLASCNVVKFPVFWIHLALSEDKA